ncbi:MAG: glycosyltransferase family 2 protein [Candidatus Omnitrophica bacterium]|nr:glycosyltransferase family 2 protein [Candidatus Omnitrophota bacterium]
MNLCVLLPAYNEEKAIALIISRIKAILFDIIVVDDGSTDNTFKEAESAQAVVIRHEKNLGKGQALRTGFRYIVDKKFDGVLVMDADGQHSPDEIHKFMEYAGRSSAGIIIGNRMLDPKGMPWIRKITNIYTSYAVSKIIGYKIPDTQCGFRLIKAQVLEKITFSTGKYDTESEMLIEAARKGFKIESIPVKTIYDNHKSRIHPIIDAVRFWRLILKSMLKK